MFKRLRQNKKAQQTAEYAILIALVVGAVIAMQTYAQRTIQARIRGASQFLALNTDAGTGIMGTEMQYEPYYLNSTYAQTRDDIALQRVRSDEQSVFSNQTRTRESGGYTVTSFNMTGGQW